MFWKRKKNHDNAPPPPQEHLRIAQAALAQGDPRHAVQHLAAALEADPADREALALVRKAILAVRDPLELAPFAQDETHYRIAAMRAYVHAWRGQLGEALNLMAQLYQAVPGLPYLPWVAEWVGRPELAELERGEILALLLSSISGKYGPRFTGPERPLLEQILAGVELYRSSHPDAVWVDTAMVTYIRKLGDVGRALGLARLIHAREPAAHTAIVLATTLREYGDVRGSLKTFQQAHGFAPDDVAILLDIADTYLMLSQLDDAAQTYQAALERAPGQPWAAPSLLYVRYAREPLGPWERQLREYAAANPANQRAGALLQRLAAYIGSLPDPPDATINVLRQVAEAGHADINHLTLSRLEAPSALLALHRWTQEHHGHAGAAVSVSEIQQPDPRRPSGPVDVMIWKYDGTRPLPTLPPPAQAVAEAVAALAAQPFQADGWMDQARQIAPRLGRAAVKDLLAVMTHPPRRPAELPVWAWIQRVQWAAAFILAWVDDGWDGSLRKRALVSLAYGPLDWSVGAAVAALGQIARNEPLLAPAVAEIYQQLLSHAPRQGGVPYIAALLTYAFELPIMPEPLAAALKPWLEGA